MLIEVYISINGNNLVLRLACLNQQLTEACLSIILYYIARPFSLLSQNNKVTEYHEPTTSR